MTARCNRCGTTRNLVHNGYVWLCASAERCATYQAAVADPALALMVEQRDEIAPPPDAPAGTPCAYCGAVDPPGGVAAASAYACRDRAGCEQRSVEHQYLTAYRDESPDRLISAADMMHLQAQAGAQVPPAPRVLTPAEMAALAASDAVGRKPVPADGALEARMTAIARRQA